MQLTVTTFLSVDGVYQGPGGPDEDRRDGFDRGGWLVPYFDEATGQFMDEVFREVDAFLLGRRTYEIFAASWPNATDPNDAVAKSLNTLPKYVASTTLEDPQWANSTVLKGDLASAVRELKERDGRELQVHGSGKLVQFLLANDLVDRLNLLVFPVIVGAGRRLFPDSGIATGLALEESRTTPSGVAISVYRPSGRPEFGTVEVT
jgi:dihydrofolate reductase